MMKILDVLAVPDSVRFPTGLFCPLLIPTFFDALERVSRPPEFFVLRAGASEFDSGGLELVELLDSSIALLTIVVMRVMSR